MVQIKKEKIILKKKEMKWKPSQETKNQGEEENPGEHGATMISTCKSCRGVQTHWSVPLILSNDVLCDLSFS